jgi:allophanate hydrolase subunit 2
MNLSLGKAKIVFTAPGTSIQDMGRHRVASIGIPAAGVMDQKSYAWANHVLQNEENAAVLEISQPGLTLVFDHPTELSFAGAKVQIFLNGEAYNSGNTLLIQTEDEVKFGKFYSGRWLYMGIKSGFATEKFYDSRSDFPFISRKFFRETGDILPYLPIDYPPQRNASPKWNTSWFEDEVVVAYRGPDWSLLSGELQQQLLKGTFRISTQSNRMGIQLEDLLPNTLPELPTNPVFPGTVQLSSGGKLMVLMRDAGLTGGYPRILQLSENSISKIAQKRPGEVVRFHVE